MNISLEKVKLYPPIARALSKEKTENCSPVLVRVIRPTRRFLRLIARYERVLLTDSAQRRWQLKQLFQGHCPQCGMPKDKKDRHSWCPTCREKANAPRRLPSQCN
jgi:rubrerythrin